MLRFCLLLTFALVIVADMRSADLRAELRACAKAETTAYNKETKQCRLMISFTMDTNDSVITQIENHLKSDGIVVEAHWELAKGLCVFVTKGQARTILRYLRKDHREVFQGMQADVGASISAFGDPAWHLDRIDQKFGTDEQPYGPSNNGAGMRIYVLDTGANPAHTHLSGRVHATHSFLAGVPGIDQNGHGSAVSGAIVSPQFGSAPAAHIISCRTCFTNGQCSYAAATSAVQFAINDYTANIVHFQGAIINLSFGGNIAINAAPTPLENVLAAARAAGMEVVIAAGNSNQNVAGVSPARYTGGVTVGSSTMIGTQDSRSTFSNWGTNVKIFAPGELVTTVDFAVPAGGTTVVSGTSFSAPIVTGVLATMWSKFFFHFNHHQIPPIRVNSRDHALAELMATSVNRNILNLSGSQQRIVRSVCPHVTLNFVGLCDATP